MSRLGARVGSLRLALGWVALALLLQSDEAVAHESRMAFLDIRQSDDGFVLALKIPMLGRTAWPIDVHLPAECRQTQPERRYERPGNLVVERRFVCLERETPPVIGVAGIAGGVVDILVRFEDADGRRTARVASGAWTDVSLGAGSAGVVERFRLGVDHILTGVDHLFFVGGMLLLVRRLRTAVATITAFTVAHSVTLGLTVLDVVRVPSPPVEAFIALSIVYLAYEIVRRREAHRSSPWRMAFAFGLLHGFGFAGALLDTGLPAGDVPATLFLFNLGIETGQLLFAGVVGGGLWVVDRLLRTPTRRHLFEQAAAYGLGSIASYWVFERVASF